MRLSRSAISASKSMMYAPTSSRPAKFMCGNVSANSRTATAGTTSRSTVTSV